jgi:hypothetical protein
MKLLLLLCEAIMALHCTAARRARPAACLGLKLATRLLWRAWSTPERPALRLCCIMLLLPELSLPHTAFDSL